MTGYDYINLAKIEYREIFHLEWPISDYSEIEREIEIYLESKCEIT